MSSERGCKTQEFVKNRNLPMSMIVIRIRGVMSSPLYFGSTDDLSKNM